MKKIHSASKKRKADTSDYGDVTMASPCCSSSGRSSKVKKVLSGLRVSRAKNGFTVDKDYEGPNGEYIGRSGKTEVFTDAESMMASVTKDLA